MEETKAEVRLTTEELTAIGKELRTQFAQDLDMFPVNFGIKLTKKVRESLENGFADGVRSGLQAYGAKLKEKGIT